LQDLGHAKGELLKELGREFDAAAGSFTEGRLSALRETEAEWSDEEMLWRQAEEEAELVVEEKLKQESSRRDSSDALEVDGVAEDVDMSFEERLWRKAEREADEAVEKKLREAKVREEQLHRDADIHVDPVDGGAGAGGTAGLVLALQPREAAIAALVLPPPPPPRRLAERNELDGVLLIGGSILIMLAVCFLAQILRRLVGSAPLRRLYGRTQLQRGRPQVR